MGRATATKFLFLVMRFICAVEGEKHCLHLFTDTSEAAYACCIYLCHANKSCLLFSKGKVAPLKTMTTARLEVQAAFLGSRCVEFVCNELRIIPMNIFAWTDSITTWPWLQKPAHSWTSWVANRESAIQEISDGLNITWKICEGARNPADLPSWAEISLEVLKDWHLRQTWFVNESEWPTDCVPGPTADRGCPWHHQGPRGVSKCSFKRKCLVVKTVDMGKACLSWS